VNLIFNVHLYYYGNLPLVRPHFIYQKDGQIKFDETGQNKQSSKHAAPTKILNLIFETSYKKMKKILLTKIVIVGQNFEFSFVFFFVLETYLFFLPSIFIRNGWLEFI